MKILDFVRDVFFLYVILAMSILNSNKRIKGNVNNKLSTKSGGAMILATTKHAK